MMKVEWIIKYRGGEYPLWGMKSPKRGFQWYSTEDDAIDALDRSYMATKGSWERHGWTYTVNANDPHHVICEVEQPADKLERRNIMFPPSLWAAIEEEARENNTNVSAFVRHVMTRHLQNADWFE